MLISEQLLLLCHDAASGRPVRNLFGRLDQALTAAVIADLMAVGRIRLDGRDAMARVLAVDEQPTGDHILDSVLEEAVGMVGSRVSDLVVHRRFPIARSLTGRLIEKEVVVERTIKVWRFFSATRWPTADAASTERIRSRIRGGLLEGEGLSGSDVTIVALLRGLKHVGVLSTDLSAASRQRVERLTDNHWAYGAMKAARSDTRSRLLGIGRPLVRS